MNARAATAHSAAPLPDYRRIFYPPPRPLNPGRPRLNVVIGLAGAGKRPT